MRHFLAYLMLTIFSFQVLPVKELGRFIAKGQLTEEIQDDYEVVEIKFKEAIQLKSSPYIYSNHQVYLDTKVSLALIKLSAIAHQHFPDIFDPPPNA